MCLIPLVNVAWLAQVPRWLEKPPPRPESVRMSVPPLDSDAGDERESERLRALSVLSEGPVGNVVR
eukprot:5878411-Prymnesium_polylepis.1